MRELCDSETRQVSGGVPVCSVADVIKDRELDNHYANAGIAVYEGLVGMTSYVIGRVAGDLHPSYYQ